MDSSKPPLWHMNHRTRRQLLFRQFHSAVKKTLGRSAIEMTYGMTLRLPGDFMDNYTVDANTDLENYSDRLRVEYLKCKLTARSRQ